MMEDRGKPRIQYARTYVLLPPNADAAWARAAIDATWDRHRYSVGGSADDAGVGDLDVRRVIVVNPDGWGGESVLRDWYEKWYPGVELTFTRADTPEQLCRLLAIPEPTPENDPIHLCQLDEPWGNKRYGGGLCQTIAKQGCWLTDCAMALRYYGVDDDATPDGVDEAVGPSGYKNCEMLWSAMPKIGLEVVRSTTDAKRVEAHLGAGDVAFAEVAPGTAKHFVLVTKREGSRYWMHDPLARAGCWLDERYTKVESWRLVRKATPAGPGIAQVLVGLHDGGGMEWMADKDVRGVALVHAVVRTAPLGLDFSHYSKAGVDVYLRLNWGYADGSGTIAPPTYAAQWVQAVAGTVQRLRGCAGVIVGNEVNNPAEWPGGYPRPSYVVSPEYYVNIYNAICALLYGNATPLAPSPVDPYNVVAGQFGVAADPATWARYSYDRCSRIDFVPLHAKTQGADPTTCDDFTMFTDAPLVGRYMNLRSIEDQLEWVPGPLRSVPVIVTELNPQRRRDGKLGWDADGARWVERAMMYVRGLGCISGVVFYRYDPAGDQAGFGLAGRPDILNAIKEEARKQ